MANSIIPIINVKVKWLTKENFAIQLMKFVYLDAYWFCKMHCMVQNYENYQEPIFNIQFPIQVLKLFERNLLVCIVNLVLT